MNDNIIKSEIHKVLWSVIGDINKEIKKTKLGDGNPMRRMGLCEAKTIVLNHMSLPLNKPRVNTPRVNSGAKTK